MILRRLLSLYGLLFFVFVYAPILLVVIYSFNANTLNMRTSDAEGNATRKDSRGRDGLGWEASTTLGP